MCLQSRIARLLTAVCFSLASVSASPVFNFTQGGGVTPQVAAGFQTAANRFSSLFTDNVTINIFINFTALSPGVLGSASSTQANYTYTGVRTGLIGDATSVDDASAVANLQANPFSMLLNYTQNSPNGVGSPIPYLDNDEDANNTTIRMSHANAKALGLRAANDAANDASITFSTGFTYDFDPTDGITAGAYDFVGIATHEIGHSLGFISGVDTLDSNSSNPFFRDDEFTAVRTLDLFRYSADSLAAGAGVIDWTADNRAKYFSVNGGLTNLALFANGVVHGDGRQASHWKDSLGIGIMDPTASPGELLSISTLDSRGFDVIGWNLAVAVPEPATFLLTGLVLFSLLGYRRMRA